MLKVNAYSEKGYPTILLGDLDDTWRDNERGGSHGHLKDWADSFGWSNQICELCDLHGIALNTYLRQRTRIDHIMTACDSLLMLRSFGVGSSSVWREFNDHTPLWASYAISSGGVPPRIGPVLSKRKHTPLQNPTLMKPDDVTKFQKLISSFFDVNNPGESPSLEVAEKFIENVCRISPILARRVRPPRHKNKFSFEGWSPILVVLRAQLICMHNIRRGLAGRREKGVVWAGSDRTKHIRQHIDRWLGVVDRFTFETAEDRRKVISWTGVDPSVFWLQSDSVPSETLLVKAIADIETFSKFLHGRKRSEYRRLISHHTRQREKEFQSGKIGRAIRSVSGKQMNSYDMESLRIGKDEMLNDENDILESMTDFFVEWHTGKDVFLKGIHSDEDILRVSVKLKRVRFLRLLKNDQLHGLTECVTCSTLVVHEAIFSVLARQVPSHIIRAHRLFVTVSTAVPTETRFFLLRLRVMYQSLTT